jgi:antitoxin component YwqK of YwqJK toxin-antitoxin module
MDILNNNILQFILNSYLDYEEDILKIQQVYPSLQYNFSLKSHLKTTISFSQTIKTIYLDKKKKREIVYFDENDFFGKKLHSMNNYNSNNQLHGKQYFNNGQGYNIFNYKNGKHEGIQAQYYINGNLEYRLNYKNGKKEGEQKGWYESGKINYEHYYIDGLKHGTQVQYYFDGTPHFENFNNGKIQGSNYNEINEKVYLKNSYKRRFINY